MLKSLNLKSELRRRRFFQKTNTVSAFRLFFWKNPQRHNLLLRFTDLYLPVKLLFDMIWIDYNFLFAHPKGPNQLKHNLNQTYDYWSGKHKWQLDRIVQDASLEARIFTDTIQAKLWNQVPSLDHFVAQNSGDFLCWKYR